MAYNQYGDPYAANPPGQYGAREGEDYSTPSYAHQPLEYNSYAAGPDPAVHGALSPAPPGMDDSGPSTPKGGLGSAVGVGAEKPHPDDLDGDGVHKLGEIGGTERIVPGRAGLTHPSSFAAVGPPPRSTGILRMWRKDERGKQWFRSNCVYILCTVTNNQGGGTRSTLRLVCCCLTIGVLMAISIILTVLMYIRPPAIILKDVVLKPGSVALNTAAQTFDISVNLSIAVRNPNWFNANFERITAEVKYKDGQFGGGTIYNANFKAYTASDFIFPFYLNYSTKADTDGVMIKALSNSCGSGVSGSRTVVIDYQLKMWLKIFSATIKPSFDSSATIDCPLDADQIAQLMPTT